MLLLILLWRLSEKSEYFRGVGVHKLKVGGGGGGGGGRTVFRFKGEGALVKKRECSLSLIFEDRVDAMTLPNQLTPKQV